MRVLRLGSVMTALVTVLVGVGCGSSSDDTPAPANGAWSDTTSTLGVTQWAMVPSETGEDSATLTGYGDTRDVRSQIVVERAKDAAGNVTVRIRSVIQGPAVLEYRGLPDDNIEILQNTFPSHPDAKRALELASASLSTKTPDGPLVATQSLGPRDNGPLVGNQQQLICKDSKGNACQKPPDLGGVTGVAASCVAGVVGLAGTACLLSGVETIGIGCVISALGAAYGAYQCYDGVSQRANCTCVTPCAAQCQQKYNRQYMCAPNSRACSDAVARDRRDEAACVRACPAN
jgi:hypothetical protein